MAVRGPAMADVARLAGVSHQTVSRVLNGHPNIREQTRLRVQAAIAEPGYRPNRADRARVSRSPSAASTTSGGHESPSPQLVAEVGDLPAGTALDAGCGRGADARWLARHGWQVTAVDVSPTAVDEARALAERDAPDFAPRVCWIVADLTDWQPPQRYDLVVSQYLHPAVPFDAFVARLAQAVAPGGTLLLVGHDRADGHSATHAPEPASIDLDVVTRCLAGELWEIDVAESRIRHVGYAPTRMTLHDLVVRARRRPTD